MKILVISFVVAVVYYISNISVHNGINAQYIPVSPTPNRTFKYMKSEWMNRGGFNVSTCLKELMNCWEVMRGDVICTYTRYKQTVCETMKDLCHDFYGYIDRTWYEFTMFESVCMSDWYQEYTRRK